MDYVSSIWNEFSKTIIMIDIVGLESIGKYIIWLWSKYVKRKHIPYMDLEFHYPNYLFIALGSIVVVIFLVIAIAYFQLTNVSPI